MGFDTWPKNGASARLWCSPCLPFVSNCKTPVRKRILTRLGCAQEAPKERARQICVRTSWITGPLLAQFSQDHSTRSVSTVSIGSSWMVRIFKFAMQPLEQVLSNISIFPDQLLINLALYKAGMFSGIVFYQCFGYFPQSWSLKGSQQQAV